MAQYLNFFIEQDGAVKLEKITSIHQTIAKFIDIYKEFEENPRSEHKIRS